MASGRCTGHALWLCGQTSDHYVEAANKDMQRTRERAADARALCILGNIRINYEFNNNFICQLKEEW